ncbi:hypothetical protein BZG01_05425 [Labilibaculum manganireducens]|uniref:Uncharacterized protein n=1 Tax=Labilibaculum manganireducens TaxID=1940525 RepID=A0A2N3ICY9_9BACT|nr:hypothetical protein BZG01_05425 [Labilibaculum manganireducens]
MKNNYKQHAKTIKFLHEQMIFKHKNHIDTLAKIARNKHNILRIENCITEIILLFERLMFPKRRRK